MRSTAPPLQDQVVDHVLVTEGGWTEHRDAAVYKTENEVRVIQAERVETIPHPAHYHSETHQSLLTGEHEEWVKIDCASKGAATGAVAAPPAGASVRSMPLPPPPPPAVRTSPAHTPVVSAPYGERG